MLRSVASKVAWVGRTASMVFGLALVMALVVGVSSAALAGNLDPLKLGTAKNVATKVTTMVGKVATGSAFVVKNPSGGSALGLQVNAGQAPLTVNPEAGTATNLNADKLDGLDSSHLAQANTDGAALHAVSADTASHADQADSATSAQNANTLDGKDSTEFANASHGHSGADITSGTVAEARIDGTVARDSEVMPIVKSNDGAGSGVDADTLDGKDSRAFSIRTDHATALAHECDTVGVLNECAPVTVTVPDGKRYIVSVWSSFSASNSYNNIAYQRVWYCSAGKGPSINANNPCITPFGHPNTVQMSEFLIAASSSGETLSLSPGTYTFFTMIRPGSFDFADVSTDRVITKVMVRDATNGL